MCDVAAGVRHAYPVAKRNDGDEVGAFYSDNAPEQMAAAEKMGRRHVLNRLLNLASGPCSRELESTGGTESCVLATRAFAFVSDYPLVQELL